MKKLLVTAIGAAVAFGAFADAVRFEESTAGTVTALSQLPGGTSLWSEPEGATNTYAIGAAGTVSAPLSIASSDTQPTQALDIKTTFGKPLSLNAVSGGTTTNINDGLYFDSLVKFTVCEDAPADTYSGAKIIMWLQEVQDANGNATGTNLIVRAGYLSLDGATVTATPSNYVCSVGDNFNADAWHRVTIKAIADITKTNRGVPGFAIYLDENGDTATSDINVGNADTLDASFPASELTEAATLLNNGKALFPSLDQTSGTKATLTSASFDGTGSITDLIFTDNGPAFAKDMVAQKASVTINEIEQTGIVTLADAIDAANGAAANAAVVITLAKGFDFDAPVTIKPTNTGVSVVLDFNGFVIENTGSECLITNSAALTVTDSSGVATGGIVGPAIYQSDEATELTIAGGNFWGEIAAGDLAEAKFTISGGAFSQAGGDLELLGAQVVEGKKISDTKNADNLYPVVEDRDPVWADYLGEAVDGAYTIDNAADVLALQNGVLAGLATADVTFKQTANIDMTGVEGFYGIGWFTSSDSKDTSITASGNIPFAGTYDGQGYTISNVTLVRHNYAGVFNNVEGTVKDLTVQNIGFSGTCGEWGCAIVGNAQGSALLENLTSAGTVWGDTANHNVAGTVVRVQNTVTIRGCVNNAPITSISRRLGGIVAFTGNTAPTGTITIDSCTNNAALTVNTGTNAGDRGIGGIISRPESVADGLLIRNCANFGTLTNNGVPAKVGGIAGELNSQNYVDDGGNTFLASLGPVGNYNSKTVTGLAYAVESTINNATYLTTVKAADIAKGGTYTLLTDIAASETPVITLDDADETIAFKLNGHTFGGTIASSHDGVTAVAATADGVTTYTATITDQWAYRLGNPVDGAYVIDNATELASFKEGINTAKLSTANLTFKLGANIDASSLGYWPGIGSYKTTGSGLNNATFDGAGYTISNLSFDTGKYCAFFGRVDGSTIKDLTINVAGFKDTDAAEHGYSAFSGKVVGSTIKGCTATGTIGTTAKPAMHTCGGFAVATDGGTTFVDCTNYISVVCSLNDNPKIGGIVGLVQGSAASVVSNCWNFGNMTITPNGVLAAANGAGGLVGYAQVNLTIYGGGNEGTITWSKTTAGDSANNAVKTGTIIGFHASGGRTTVTGGTVAQADAAPAGAYGMIDGLNFATVDNNVATFVADNALAAGNIYKVWNAATATYEFAEAGTIAFDTALASPQYAITATGDLEVTSATEGTVTTFTAAVPAPSGLDPATNTPVEIEAASEAAATNAVTLVTPTGVDAAAYKNLFDFNVTEVVAGAKYAVEIAGIKETVQETVEESAMDVLDGKLGAKVQVPAGLYYKVSTYTALGGTAVETKSELSDGTGVSVSKPGTTQGFIKVEMATKPFNNNN